MLTDPATSPTPATPSPATPDDAAQIVQLRSRLVDWMQDRGISQWHHGDVSEERVRRQAEDGQWWLIRSDAGDLIAAVRTVNADPQIWGESDGRAVYVHGLMVDRGCAGLGLGRRLLVWAADHGRRRGAEVLRMDCVARQPASVRLLPGSRIHPCRNERTAAAVGIGSPVRTVDLIGRGKIRIFLARGSGTGQRSAHADGAPTRARNRWCTRDPSPGRCIGRNRISPAEGSQ